MDVAVPEHFPAGKNPRLFAQNGPGSPSIGRSSSHPRCGRVILYTEEISARPIDPGSQLM